ncbi:MAG: 3-hydroxybutyrate dehydrogenase [Candidatus Methanofastidiosum methylothiophilum]|uniref:3-hydroxybutyrate dehydrogenase n=1 Tax=Candidatus Methanofastidiosum methylothiophilum TaxID=1705564 RepID=A0A150J0K8_9EURY|nr:MAG: 3-hydroxybutyrate dehydrogenase [Candidatus Methanofastidiosum methylthiophilus]NMC77539.1 SDR family oxidoreductase [Candidatus Methanofastidiosa archaeon]
MELSEKVVLLTGASGGIGKSLLEHLNGNVKILIGSGRKNLQDFTRIKESDKFNYMPMDLTSEDNIKFLFSYIIEEYGRLDITINTIGGSLFSHNIEDFPIEEYDKVMNTNLKTAFMLTKESIKYIKRNGEVGGNILHFVSSSARDISPGKAPYGISKGGLESLIRYAAFEAAKYNIKVNGISPTYVFTERHEFEIQLESRKSGVPIGDIEKKKIEGQLLKRKLYPKDLFPLVDLLINTEVITGQIYDCTLGKTLG